MGAMDSKKTSRKDCHQYVLSICSINSKLHFPLGVFLFVLESMLAIMNDTFPIWLTLKENLWLRKLRVLTRRNLLRGVERISMQLWIVFASLLVRCHVFYLLEVFIIKVGKLIFDSFTLQGLRLSSTI